MKRTLSLAATTGLIGVVLVFALQAGAVRFRCSIWAKKAPTGKRVWRSCSSWHERHRRPAIGLAGSRCRAPRSFTARGIAFVPTTRSRPRGKRFSCKRRRGAACERPRDSRRSRSWSRSPHGRRRAAPLRRHDKTTLSVQHGDGQEAVTVEGVRAGKASRVQRRRGRRLITTARRWPPQAGGGHAGRLSWP